LAAGRGDNVTVKTVMYEDPKTGGPRYQDYSLGNHPDAAAKIDTPKFPVNKVSIYPATGFN
jgi:hypothetical protein